MSLSTDGGVTLKYTFPVADTGDFSGEAPAGTYMLVYRAADTPAGKMVDSIRGVKIVAGEDTAQDDDMSRQEYIDKMTPDEKKQLEDLKKANAEALKANIGHQPAQCRPEGRRPGQAETSTAQTPPRRRLSARRPKGGPRCQGRRDQDCQVHRHRQPDDQGYGASSRTRPCCGPTWATGRPASRNTTMPSRHTRRPSIWRPPRRNRAEAFIGLADAGLRRGLRAHRQGS